MGTYEKTWIGIFFFLLALLIYAFTQSVISNKKTSSSEEEKLSILRQVDVSPYHLKEECIVLEVIKNEFVSKAIVRRVSDGFIFAPLFFIKDLKVGDKVHIGTLITKINESRQTQVVLIVIK